MPELPTTPGAAVATRKLAGSAGLAVSGIGLGALAVLLLLITPKRLPESELAAPQSADLRNGEAIFIASNCSACHMTPGQDKRTLLGGGRPLQTSFGIFVAPNISSDPKFGIGSWREAEFLNAMKRGTGRLGEHLYPAFPYPAYSLMQTSDVRDLFAYLKTLPAVPRQTSPHQLHFPFGIRAGIGVWKALYFRPHDFVPDPNRTAAWNRGAYLAEGPAHCVECHTPRDLFGGPKASLAYSGAPSLDVGGRFASNITPHPDGIGDWTPQELADFLATGQDKCFNEPTGMRDVIASTSKLSQTDLAALAEYIHDLPARPGNSAHKGC